MDISFLLELVQKYGYFSMFVFNWLLLFGLPIPNEVAAAFSGVLTEISHFNPFYAFLSAYAGLITSNTFAYFIGRSLGHRLLNRLNKTTLKQVISRFNNFLEKHGEWAIAFSFSCPEFVGQCLTFWEPIDIQLCVICYLLIQQGLFGCLFISM
ncbi:YbfM [Planococcus halocryophilus Or1]|uniref:DedA family protein n=1 Tax=Planococcus halocryophilus TaxID=1215089 RepID=UPI0002B88E25|nr:VTT domain-containing protein [Planococcus halocryophilus]EMF46873.1 YbfM [Planococcus halocryophilus Or1]